MLCVLRPVASLALLAALLLGGACDDRNVGVGDGGLDAGGDRGPFVYPDGRSADQLAPDLGAPDLPAADLPVTPPADLGPMPDVSGTAHADFVLDAVLLPTSSGQATQYGFDLDGDGSVDNALGTILSAVGAMTPGMSVQPAVDEAVNRGDLLLLFRLYSNNMVDQPSLVAHHWRAAATQCCTAVDPTACAAEAQATCFSGSHSFTPVPPATQLLGTLSGGTFAFGPTSLQLSLPLFGGTQIDVTLIGARLRGTLAGGGITDGAIGGAISKQDLDNQVIPAIAAAMDSAYQADPVGNAMIGQLFDTNKDGRIDATEVAGNPIVATFLTPDVDADGDGTYEMSIGLGFTAAGATIL